VDRVEARCWLDWCANRSTVLGSVEVDVVITSDGGTWKAQGRLVKAEDEELEGLAFLRDLDDLFTLRFEDGSDIPVIVQLEEIPGRFTLHEYLS
jgi:hypothetical protein